MCGHISSPSPRSSLGRGMPRMMQPQDIMTSRLSEIQSNVLGHAFYALEDFREL